MGLGFRSGWILCALLALNPHVVMHSVSIMSELTFTVAAFASLAACERVPGAHSPSRLAFLAGAVAGIACLIKTAGLVLLFSAAVYFVLKRQTTRVLPFAAGMAPAVSVWIIWAKTHGSVSTDIISLYYTNYGGFHLSSFSWQDLPLLAATNAAGLFLGIGGFAFYGMEAGRGYQVLFCIVSAAAFGGLVRLWRRNGPSAPTLFALAYLLLLLVWHLCPGDHYERLLFPVFPILLVGLAVQFEDTLRRLARLLHRPGAGALVLSGVLATALVSAVSLLAFCDAAVLRHFSALQHASRRAAQENRTAYEWISANLPADATFLSATDAVLYLHTGRRACTLIVPPKLSYANDRAGMFRWFGAFPRFMRSHRLDHLLISWHKFEPSGLHEEGLMHMREIARKSPELTLVKEWEGMSIYALKR
jgi:hypothetical protein